MDLRDVKKEINLLYKKYKTKNPYEIADAMGVIIHKQNLGKCTRGLYYYSRRIKQIIIHDDLPEWMEKFVLAHELGHLVMHPKYNAPFLQSTLLTKDRYEIEANAFAAHLLISDKELEDLWEYSLDDLAMFYGLPREIIELRLN